MALRRSLPLLLLLCSCEWGPFYDVGEVDCRNPHAESCVTGIGSALARGRFFISTDEPGEVEALIRHELEHASLWDRPDACASHSADCGWVDP